MTNEPKTDCVNAVVYENDMVLCVISDKPCSNYDTMPCEDYEVEK
jgi:hypothetical protein